ncbi:MAG: sulfite exporter TauE/SafE family protein [Burkholderiaceae bacterium]
MTEILFLCLFAFFAGLIDAAVGGGGLIQIPALFNFMPTTAPATLFGTNKIASISGTFFAARSYFKRVRIAWALVLPAAASAFVMAFAGAATVSMVPKSFLKPVVFFLLVVIAIYTLWKKDFGTIHKPVQVGRREKIIAVLIGGAIGFYDGLFGPGTGSFLIFMFIRFFAFDFLNASAASKFVNLATNAAALAFFIPAGYVLYQLAIPMALANIVGAVSGTWLAMHKGAGFVRVLFLVLVTTLIMKLGYEIFF